MTREEKILALIGRAGKGLEIGPSYSPIAPKSQGWNVEIVDHLDADGLRQKYAAWSVDTSRVEHVDHVVADKTIAGTVGKPEHFDFVIASHVIEHSTDLIGFLQDCQSLLRPGGILSLAVPDKRFCFDVFQSVSTTGMAFQAHLEKRKRHAPGTIFDAYANHTMRGSDLTGFDRRATGLSLAHDLSLTKALTDQYVSQGQFLDMHAWNFTPSSFLLIVQDLNELKFIDLGVAASHGSSGFEFFVSLKKGYASPKQDRIALLRAIADELCA